MSDHILIDKAAGVLTLTLNRPEKKNALTAAMYAALGGAIAEADADSDVRCVVLQANGDSFTAGNDLSEFAAVQGRAVGVGTTMLLHCDLVFVADDAVLSTPFVNLALVPEAASSILLPARIGHARAFAMFVLGQSVDARTAVAWGLANSVLPAAELRAQARTAAEAIAARPPAAVAITKRLMRDTAAIEARIADEGRHFAAQLRSDEARDAFAAFQRKRRE
jgi:enoyl-CoA hydratase/carnithine racemase